MATELCTKCGHPAPPRTAARQPHARPPPPHPPRQCGERRAEPPPPAVSPSPPAALPPPLLIFTPRAVPLCTVLGVSFCMDSATQNKVVLGCCAFALAPWGPHSKPPQESGSCVPSPPSPEQSSGRSRAAVRRSVLPAVSRRSGTAPTRRDPHPAEPLLALLGAPQHFSFSFFSLNSQRWEWRCVQSAPPHPPHSPRIPKAAPGIKPTRCPSPSSACSLCPPLPLNVPIQPSEDCTSITHTRCCSPPGTAHAWTGGDGGHIPWGGQAGRPQLQPQQ